MGRTVTHSRNENHENKGRVTPLAISCARSFPSFHSLWPPLPQSLMDHPRHNSFIGRTPLIIAFDGAAPGCAPLIALLAARSGHTRLAEQSHVNELSKSMALAALDDLARENSSLLPEALKAPNRAGLPANVTSAVSGYAGRTSSKSPTAPSVIPQPESHSGSHMVVRQQTAH